MKTGKTRALRGSKFEKKALHFACVMALCGCSALGEITALRMDAEERVWIARPPIPERPHAAFMTYEFARDRVAVLTCSLQVTMRIAGFGPPLLPLIPGALFPYTRFDPSTEANLDDLFFYVQLSSPAEESRIDFSTVRLRVNGSAEPARLKSVRRYGDNERWPEVCGRHLAEGSEVVAMQQVFDHRSAQYVLIFDSPWESAETFSIDLGSITSAGRQIPLPPMMYRRDSYFFYVPLFMPPGGHGQQPWVIHGGSR